MCIHNMVSLSKTAPWIGMTRFEDVPVFIIKSLQVYNLNLAAASKWQYVTVVAAMGYFQG